MIFCPSGQTDDSEAKQLLLQKKKSKSIDERGTKYADEDIFKLPDEPNLFV